MHLKFNVRDFGNSLLRFDSTFGFGIRNCFFSCFRTFVILSISFRLQEFTLRFQKRCVGFVDRDT